MKRFIKVQQILIIQFLHKISYTTELKRIPHLMLFLLCSHLSFGQNPIVKDIGMSDPHIRVFNDTIYLYSGHDSHPDDKTWVMKDWRVFSSTDLLDWKLRETISPLENYMDDNSTDCWASDAATRNGKYYFYFSDRKRGIGVMTADSPTGPFKDPLNKPLVSPLHDPTIFIDDDQNKTPYIIYGDKSDAYFVAKLNEDMISLAEKPRAIEINGKEWENAPEWMDKNYVFKYRGIYYLSWGKDYAVSNNIYGPYQCVGEVGKGHHLSEFAHGSFFWWKGQFYHIWCYYLRDGFKYRESMITYCHFDENGKIVTDTDFLDQHFANGVGQYEANWPKIQAEWYYEKSPEIEKRSLRADMFVLRGIKNGSWVRFANMNFDGSQERFDGVIRCNKGKGKIEVRVDSPSGLLLGFIEVKAKNGVNNYQNVSFPIEKITGKRDLYLTFSGNKNYEVEVDYFGF